MELYRGSLVRSLVMLVVCVCAVFHLPHSLCSPLPRSNNNYNSNYSNAHHAEPQHQRFPQNLTRPKLNYRLPSQNLTSTSLFGKEHNQKPAASMKNLLNSDAKKQRSSNIVRDLTTVYSENINNKNGVTKSSNYQLQTVTKSVLHQLTSAEDPPPNQTERQLVLSPVPSAVPKWTDGPLEKTQQHSSTTDQYVRRTLIRGAPDRGHSQTFIGNAPDRGHSQTFIGNALDKGQSQLHHKADITQEENVDQNVIDHFNKEQAGYHHHMKYGLDIVQNELTNLDYLESDEAPFHYMKDGLDIVENELTNLDYLESDEAPLHYLEDGLDIENESIKLDRLESDEGRVSEWPDSIDQHSAEKHADAGDLPEHVEHRHQKTEDMLSGLHSYEFVVPELVDHTGNFVSFEVNHKPSTRQGHPTTQGQGQHRERRSVHTEEWIYYQLNAFGKHFHLNLTLNRKLLAPAYVIENWDKSSWKPGKQDNAFCHYIGHLRDDDQSTVAISNCYGLHGMFATGQEEYFVEPLWNDTRSSKEGRYHVVYKRSDIKSHHQDSHCGVTEKSSKPKLPQHWWHSKSSWSFNDVLKPHHHGYHHKDKWRTRRRSKRSTSKERYVETLVVVDKQMIGYHGEKSVESYVLTVMNIVAKLYRDATLGNAVNILITRLVILRGDVDRLELSHHADQSLESFCAWQQHINAFEGSSDIIHQGVAHHDNAILITRFDICLYKNEPCGTLGLAPVSGMCEPHRSCSINEDIGLSSAFTIAHEIGHNFGMQHDGVGNECGKPGHDPARIMAAQLADNTLPISWSSCSKTYITDFLDSGRGGCLDNPPPEVDFDLPSKLPGELNNADKQCEFTYGTGSKPCRPKEMCQKLYCTNHNEKCVSNNIPAAEGTPCARENDKDGWCYRGQCEKESYIPKLVDGGWGDWSEWGECSRSCGGGVTASSRQCDNPVPEHGGQYCLGERKRYKSCNIQDCDFTAMDFRELQCQRYNNRTFRNRLYEWKPFQANTHLNPCALNCLADGYNFYTEMTPKVDDGTPCHVDSLDICINGECKHVGCDKILGSATVEDECRVCDGKGDTCETIHGEFTDRLADKSDSYQKVVLLPQGAVHVRVEETIPSLNYLALRSKDTGHYYINGAWTIDWPRKFKAANTVFNYIRPKDGPESFTALGPLAEDLLVMILLQETNLGISYQYNMPINNATQNGTEVVWQFTPWSECSASCARGQRVSTAVCIRKDNRKVIQNNYCPSHLRPKDQKTSCNEQPCPPQWNISPWSECSKSCSGGVRTRTALCERKINEHITEVVERTACPGEEPSEQEACNKEKCPPHWATDGYSSCWPTCGDGYKTRNVYCVSADGLYLKDEHCDAGKKPEKRVKCNLPACPPAQWVNGAWGECSTDCGVGQQRRNVACRTMSGLPSNDCDQRTRPHDTQECHGACEVNETTECRDDNKVAYCPLVLKFRFCHRAYFYQMCCKTCSEHGYKV